MIIQADRFIFFDQMALFHYVSAIQLSQKCMAVVRRYLLDEPFHHIGSVETRACIPNLPCIAVLLVRMRDTAIDAIVFSGRPPTDLNGGKGGRCRRKSLHQSTSDDRSPTIGY